MSIYETAKEITIALIEKNEFYSLYNREKPEESAERAGEAYKIILKAVSAAKDATRE